MKTKQEIHDKINELLELPNKFSNDKEVECGHSLYFVDEYNETNTRNTLIEFAEFIIGEKITVL